MIKATLPLIRVLRPAQWVKNALLFLPALAAHAPLDAVVLLSLAFGFIAFSAASSAGYVINDLLDADADRHHPYKRMRPIASGLIARRTAIVLATLLLAFGLTVAALALTRAFLFVLIVYFVLSVSYSTLLKRIALLDVVLLGVLYSLRLLAGSVLAVVPLSRWFLAFSIFFFLSLALAKRVVELKEQAPETGARRGYARGDDVVLISLGNATSMAAALVYCLYITSPDVNELYFRPDWLWAGLPILVYWLARVWLLVARGQMHDDPVVFALTDRVTLALALIFVVLMVVAT